jgi:hypothetical protein
VGRRWWMRASSVGTVALVWLAAAALPALAFTTAPSSLTVQGGQEASVSLGGLPVSPDGRPACLEVSGRYPSTTISFTFSPICGSQAGWSSTMDVLTIPGTPAGVYQVVIEACVAPGCSYRSTSGNIGSTTPIETQAWTLTVTPGLPVAATSPAPASPAASPLPASTPAPASPAPAARQVARPQALATTPEAHSSPATTPASASPSPVTASSAPSPAASPPGLSAAAGTLVLDHGQVPPGGTVRMSGSGCAPNAVVTVQAGDEVTGNTVADGGGTFRARLRLPSAIPVGRYEVMAECGQVLSTVVDVQAKSDRLALWISLSILGLGLALGLGLWIGQRLQARAVARQ